LFAEHGGGPIDPHNARRAFARRLKRAQLSSHFTPYCLRHTFASILIAEGKSPAYVQAQLGHASITLTVDTYGKWLPRGDKAAVDSLGDAAHLATGIRGGDRVYASGTVQKRSGDQVVTFLDQRYNDPAETSISMEMIPPEFHGVTANGPCRTRTYDPLLKRQLL